MLFRLYRTEDTMKRMNFWKIESNFFIFDPRLNQVIFRLPLIGIPKEIRKHSQHSVIKFFICVVRSSDYEINLKLDKFVYRLVKSNFSRIF